MKKFFWHENLISEFKLCEDLANFIAVNCYGKESFQVAGVKLMIKSSNYTENKEFNLLRMPNLKFSWPVGLNITTILHKRAINKGFYDNTTIKIIVITAKTKNISLSYLFNQV